MLRGILGVIVGYVVMLIAVVVTFMGLYLVLGANGAFKPESYEPSVTWLVASFVLALIAAIIGGLVCVAVAGGKKSAVALAGLVIVLGIIFAIPTLTASSSETPAVRGGEVGNFEAMTKAKEPGWVALMNPVIGAVGVMIGSRLRRS